MALSISSHTEQPSELVTKRSLRIQANAQECLRRRGATVAVRNASTEAGKYFTIATDYFLPLIGYHPRITIVTSCAIMKTAVSTFRKRPPARYVPVLDELEIVMEP